MDLAWSMIKRCVSSSLSPAMAAQLYEGLSKGRSGLLLCLAPT